MKPEPAIAAILRSGLAISPAAIPSSAHATRTRNTGRSPMNVNSGGAEMSFSAPAAPNVPAAIQSAVARKNDPRAPCIVLETQAVHLDHSSPPSSHGIGGHFVGSLPGVTLPSGAVRLFAADGNRLAWRVAEIRVALDSPAWARTSAAIGVVRAGIGA